MYEKIINMTFQSVFEKKIILIKAMAVYTLLMILIDYISMKNIVYIEGRAEIESGFLFFITALLTYFILLLVAISTHRILILGEESIPKWGLFEFSKREWSFIVNGLLMGLMVAAAIIPIILLGAPLGKAGGLLGMAAFLIVSFILISRFSLVFPAISVDNDMSLSDAWNYTKNYKLLVFITVILFPLIFSFIFGLVYGIAINFLSGILGLNLFFFNSLLNIFIGVFAISALSATYILICKEHPEFFETRCAKKEDVELRETVVDINNHIYKAIIHDKNDISFEELVKKLKSQYLKLGFTNVVIDKSSSWMIKNPEFNESYVLLSHINDEYVIEVYKTEMIEFIDEVLFAD